MRISIVSLLPRLAWAGSEELWAAMAGAALDAGHQVTASVERHPRVPRKVEALAQRGARVVRRVRRTRPSANRVASALVRRPVAWPPPRPVVSFGHAFEPRPDVILINLGSAYEFLWEPAPLEELAASRIPYVSLVQANDEGAIPPDYRERAVPFFEGARRTLWVSEGNLRAARRQMAHPLPNGQVVRNPVNLADTSAAPWPKESAEECARWASVARLHNMTKGQDVLFEALSDPRWKSRAWRLRLHGEGPDEEHGRALSRMYGIQDRVEFAGHVSDIHAVWARHHMLLLPSRMEGTPLALVEAMLCARPALATHVAGHPEWIQDGSSGFLADAPTAPLLDSALERAWSERARWQAMGEEARGAALARFDPHAGATLLRIVEEAARSRA